MEAFAWSGADKIYESLREVCGDPKLDRRKISCWYRKFSLGQDGIKDKEGSGRLRTSTDNTSEEIIAVILEEDTSMICEEIAMKSSAPKLSIYRLLPAVSEKKKANVRYIAYRKSTQTAFTHYKDEVLPHAANSSDMSPSKFDVFPELCCIRCGPDEERILDIFPREDGARNSG